jgi:hypothetical protein
VCELQNLWHLKKNNALFMPALYVAKLAMILMLFCNASNNLQNGPIPSGFATVMYVVLLARYRIHCSFIFNFTSLRDSSLSLFCFEFRSKMLSSLRVKNQVYAPRILNGKESTFLYVSIFTYSDSKREDTNSELKASLSFSDFKIFLRIFKKKFYVLPTQCIYVFCVDLRTNSDYFTVQH